MEPGKGKGYKVFAHIAQEAKLKEEAEACEPEINAHIQWMSLVHQVPDYLVLVSTFFKVL